MRRLSIELTRVEMAALVEVMAAYALCAHGNEEEARTVEVLAGVIDRFTAAIKKERYS